MADQLVDHEEPDDSCLALAYVAQAFQLVEDLSGHYRHSPDRCLRAAQSIALNIAETSGERSL